MLEKQLYGSVVAQVVIDVNAGTVLEAYGVSPAGVTFVVAKTEWSFALNGEVSAIPTNRRSVITTLQQPRANPVLLAQNIVGALDVNATVRVQLVDAAFAPAAGAAGDILSITVMRTGVPV